MGDAAAHMDCRYRHNRARNVRAHRIGIRSPVQELWVELSLAAAACYSAAGRKRNAALLRAEVCAPSLLLLLPMHVPHASVDRQNKRFWRRAQSDLWHAYVATGWAGTGCSRRPCTRSSGLGTADRDVPGTALASPVSHPASPPGLLSPSPVPGAFEGMPPPALVIQK